MTSVSTRISSRVRRPKDISNDFVDASFSESETPTLKAPPPPPPSNTKTALTKSGTPSNGCGMSHLQQCFFLHQSEFLFSNPKQMTPAIHQRPAQHVLRVKTQLCSKVEGGRSMLRLLTLTTILESRTIVTTDRERGLRRNQVI